jgi:trimethylamine---corrinoid protein Co-methyltransferase
VVDAQSGHEKTLTALLPALAGANLIYGLGMIESGMTFDFGQLVMDNEFARMIKFAVGGIPVNDETLAVDVIAEVGAFKDFLGHEHTMKHMREQSPSALLDRRVREDWEASGSTTLYERATAKAREILDTYRPEPLPESVAAEMRDIVADAEKDLGVTSTVWRV